MYSYMYSASIISSIAYMCIYWAAKKSEILEMHRDIYMYGSALPVGDSYAKICWGSTKHQ